MHLLWWDFQRELKRVSGNWNFLFQWTTVIELWGPSLFLLRERTVQFQRVGMPWSKVKGLKGFIGYRIYRRAYILIVVVQWNRCS